MTPRPGGMPTEAPHRVGSAILPRPCQPATGVYTSSVECWKGSPKLDQMLSVASAPALAALVYSAFTQVPITWV